MLVSHPRLAVKSAIGSIVILTVAATLPVGCGNSEREQDASVINDLPTSIKEAKVFRARNCKSPGWSVEPTDFVDLPFLFIYNKKGYRRKGGYHTILPEIYTSETLEFTALICGRLEKKDDLVAKALESMCKSAGFK
ncbi:MAG: hypothetical protein K8T89_25205 [Planctomycetes bacterium]|nr:hypothetical protein [Planctomycetota bacterium]